jgi:hypothetical protein
MTPEERSRAMQWGIVAAAIAFNLIALYFLHHKPW